MALLTYILFHVIALALPALKKGGIYLGGSCTDRLASMPPICHPSKVLFTRFLKNAIICPF